MRWCHPTFETRCAGLRDRVHFLIFLCAFVLTALTTITSIVSQKAYLKTHPYYLDAVAYSYQSARLQAQSEFIPKSKLIVDEFFHDNRSSLRNVIIFLGGETLAKDNVGHVLPNAIGLFCFLFCFILWMFRQNQNFKTTLFAAALFCAWPLIQDLKQGLASNWLDLNAGLYLSTAYLSLLLSDRGRRTKWMMLMAIFFAFACLTRFIVASASVVVLGVPLLIFMGRHIKNYRIDPTSLINFIKAGLCALVVYMLLGGWWMFYHLESVLSFYTNYEYSLGSGFSEMFKLFLIFCFQKIYFFSSLALGLPALLMLVSINMLIFCKARDAAISLDWKISFLVVVIVVTMYLLMETYATHLLLFVFPILFCLLVYPIKTLKQSSAYLHQQVMALTACAFLLYAGGAVHYVKKNIRNISAEDADLKAFSLDAAKYISSLNIPVVWNIFVDEVTWIPTMESYYQSGRLPLPAGQKYFNEHLTAWKADYPSLEAPAIADRIFAASCRWLNLAVVFDDPKNAFTNISLLNDYSRNISELMAAKISASATWQKLGVFESTTYGKVAFYKNLNADPDNYRQFLFNPVSP